MTSIKPTYIKGDYKKSRFFDNKSRLVLGCSGLGGVWRPIEETDAVGTLMYALENGVRVFDTAPSYNKSQFFLGKALRQWQGEKPFISTKVGRLKTERAEDTLVNYSTKSMKLSLYNSLEVLGLDAIDLLFLHEPHLVPMDRMDEIMECLQSFKKEGLVKRLGIGGNPTEAFYPHIVKQNFDVLSGFLKLDACNISAFDEVLPILVKENIAYYAASALHMGLLGRRLEMYANEMPNNKWISNLDVHNALKVNHIAKKYDIPLSRLALRYIFSTKEADRVVVGPTKQEQMEDLIEAWGEGKLPEEVFDEITSTIISKRSEIK